MSDDKLEILTASFEDDSRVAAITCKNDPQKSESSSKPTVVDSWRWDGKIAIVINHTAARLEILHQTL